jgi:hypothetical protein
MIRKVEFFLVLLLHTSVGVPIDDDDPNFVVDISDSDGQKLGSYRVR